MADFLTVYSPPLQASDSSTCERSLIPNHQTF
jgi:hypothetical protein